MDTIASSYASRALPLASILLLASVADCTREPDAPPRPPNVLLISIDSARADHFGCYGYRSRTGAPTSPHLDRLANEGVVFEHAQSTTSWTMPSHHALFSGLPDLLHGAVDDEHGATPRRVELAQVLADAGYATAGFFSGPYLGPRYGFGGGFDLYENVAGVEEALAASGVSPTSDPAAGPQEMVARAGAALETGYHRASSARRVSDRAIAWLAEQRRRTAEQPFFLFLHYFDVHYDYVPPEEGYARRFWPNGRRPRISGDAFFENPEVRAGMDAEDLAGVVSWYDGEILWTDEQVGRVLDRLASLQVADDTLVVVVSDHGDEFFEHGVKGHRQNLFEPTLRIALVARLPGRLPQGRRVPQRVSLVDVAPTILDLAGALSRADFHAPPLAAASGLEHGMWGRSLAPLIDGREQADRDCIGFLTNRWPDTKPAVDTWALWTGPLKVIVSKRYERFETESGAKGLKAIEHHGSVFDLTRDPGELENLARDRDRAVTAAIDRFDAHFADGGALARLGAQLDAGPPPAPLSPAVAHVLAQLGYPAPASTSPLRLPPGTKLSQVLPPPPRFPREP